MGALRHTAKKMRPAPTPRTKQKTFKRSLRFYRGRIIRLLTAEKEVSMATLKKLLHDCPFPLLELLAALEKEGMLTRTKDHVTL